MGQSPFPSGMTRSEDGVEDSVAEDPAVHPASRVRNDPHTSSLMRRADVGRSNNVPLRVMPEAGQSFGDNVEPSTSEELDVLNQDPSGPKLANESLELKPESGTLAFEPRPFARRRDVLTREPSAEDVDWGDAAGADLSDVAESGDVWPVLAKDPLAEGVLLTEPLDLHSGALQSQVPPADAGEQRSDAQSHRAWCLLWHRAQRVSRLDDALLQMSSSR